MTIGERIKKRREELKFSQEELAQKLGYKSRSSINKIELNERNLTQSKIKAIADALHTTPGYIMGWEETKNEIPITGMVPILGKIAAGLPILAEEDVEGWLPITRPHPELYMYLHVEGDSMINAGIPDGCLALIRKQNCCDNGDIVACRIESDEVTLKRYYLRGDNVILKPENSAYEPIVVPTSDFNEGIAQIIGVLYDVTVRFKQ